MQQAFAPIYPFALSYQTQSLDSVMKLMQSQKKRKYNQSLFGWRAWYIYTACLYNLPRYEFGNEKILSAIERNF